MQDIDAERPLVDHPPRAVAAGIFIYLVCLFLFYFLFALKKKSSFSNPSLVRKIAEEGVSNSRSQAWKSRHQLWSLSFACGSIASKNGFIVGLVDGFACSSVNVVVNQRNYGGSTWSTSNWFWFHLLIHFFLFLKKKINSNF